MKKSTVALIALLSFFAGVSGGALIGFVLSPIKKGLNFSITLKNCGNNCTGFLGSKKHRKKHKPKKAGKLGEQNKIPLLKGINNRKEK